MSVSLPAPCPSSPSFSLAILKVDGRMASDDTRRKRRKMTLGAFRNVEKDMAGQCSPPLPVDFSSSLDEEAGLRSELTTSHSPRPYHSDAMIPPHRDRAMNKSNKSKDLSYVPVINLRPRPHQRRTSILKTRQNESCKITSSLKIPRAGTFLPFLPSLSSGSYSSPCNRYLGRTRKQLGQFPLPPPPPLQEITKPSPFLATLQHHQQQQQQQKEATKRTGTPISFSSSPPRLVPSFDFATPTTKAGVVTHSPAVRPTFSNTPLLLDTKESSSPKKATYFSEKESFISTVVTKPRAMRPTMVSSSLHSSPAGFTTPTDPGLATKTNHTTPPL